MERCPRQHRIGETCGAKLVHSDYIEKKSDPCRVCQEIEVKKRRLQKIEDNIRRWNAEGDKFAHSLGKAKGEQDQLIEKIKELSYRRQSVIFRTGGGDRSSQVSDGFDNALNPPLSENGGSYTYRSQALRGYPPQSQSPGVNTQARPLPQSQLQPPRHAVPYPPYPQKCRPS